MKIKVKAKLEYLDLQSTVFYYKALSLTVSFKDENKFLKKSKLSEYIHTISQGESKFIEEEFYNRCLEWIKDKSNLEKKVFEMVNNHFNNYKEEDTLKEKENELKELLGKGITYELEIELEKENK